MKAVALVAVILSLAGGGFAMSNEQAYKVWSVSSMHKVLPDEAAPKGGSVDISLFAARGERESAQVVVAAGSEPLKAVHVSVSELSGADGKRISAKNVDICRVAYINLPNLKKIAPDPLPPAAPFDVAAGKNQPVWITISVPRDAAPGKYSGEVVIRPDGQPEQRVPIEINVWNFTLPEGPSAKTAFGLSMGLVAKQHGVDEHSAAGRQLAISYYNFLVDRWVSPYYLPVPVASDQASKYISDPRVTSYTIPYSDNIDEMRASVESLRKRNLLTKAYFYPIDEPFTSDAYKRLNEVCGKIHQVDPKLRIVIPYFRDPDFETKGKTIHELADGLLNIWCPNLQYYDGNKQRLQAKLDKGEEFWWYVCCGPGAPYPNYFLNMDGASHRVLPWMQWKYHCQGQLYWNTTWWSPNTGTSDPWEDMATVKDINKDLYGDGSLLYPGKKVGINGPVSSIRLELLREGLEDYEYLVLLEKKLGRAGAEKFISDIITSPTQFNHDINKWVKARQAIGNELGR